MEVVAALPFIDKYTGEFYKAGRRLSVSDERGTELLSGGFVTVEAGEQKTAPKPRRKGAKQHDGRKQAETSEV